MRRLHDEDRPVFVTCGGMGAISRALRRKEEGMVKRDELTNPASCMSRAKEDEMVFVLLGRDAAAPVAIRAWVEERIRSAKTCVAMGRSPRLRLWPRRGLKRTIAGKWRWDDRGGKVAPGERRRICAGGG